MRNAQNRLKIVCGMLILLFVLDHHGLAQNGQSALSLFSQGLTQYESGDYESARRILDQVDPLQLDKDQRTRLFEVLQDLERAADRNAEPAALYQQAMEAKSSSQWGRALAYFRAAATHPNADATLRDRATAQIAEIRRLQNPDLTRMRQSLAEAVAEIEAGKLDSAEQKLGAIRQSGVDLGWLDSERVQRQLERIAQLRRQAEEATAAAAVQPVAVEPAQPTTDVLADAVNLLVQEKITQAQEAERNRQYRLAVNLYQQALAHQPENAALRESLTSAQAKANQWDSPKQVLDQEIQAMRLRASQAEAEFSELVNRADTLRQTRNFVAAQEAVQQAKILLDRNQTYLPASRYRDLRESVTQLGVRIAEEQRLDEITEARRREDETKQKAATLVRQAETERQDEVYRLLARARDLRREQKYDRALELLKQAQFLDPQNPAVELMLDTIHEMRNWVAVKELVKQRAKLISDHSVDNTEATLPQTELMTFPPDWPELTARRFARLRGSDSAVSEINREIELKLSQPIDATFEAQRLSNVIDFIQNRAGVNIIVNWTALQNVGVERDLPITLPQLSNQPASTVLNLVLEQASANNEFDPIGYSVHEGLVRISTKRELKQRTVAARSYDIRDLLVQVPTFGDAPTLSIPTSSSSVGGAGGGGGGGGGGGTLFSPTATTPDVQQRGERTTEIMDLIRSQTGEQNDWVEFGGTISSIRSYNDQLLVRTTPETHRQIHELLERLRRAQSMQISVEARFLLVDQNFFDETGIDVDFELGRNNSTDSGFSPVTIGQDSYTLTARPLQTGLPGSFGSAAPAIGALERFVPGSGVPGTGRSLDISFSFVDDWAVNVLIRASQAARRTIALSAPRITFFNTQSTFITINRQIAYVSGLEAVPDAGVVPIVSTLPVGFSLAVEGTISADRRFVTMTVQPQLSTLVEIRRVEIILPVENTTVVDNNNNNNNNNGNTLVRAFIEAPLVEVTQLQATVSVPDKGTLLLGGQRLVGDIEVEAGIPVLSKIPLLNRFFTNRTKVKDERILLILIKPTIIIQDEEEDLRYPGLKDNPDSFNIGRASAR